MKVLVKKTPEEIAEELDRETVEVGSDFSSKLEDKLKKYGYDPMDMEVRKAVF